MSPSDIIDKLHNYVEACNVAASTCESRYVEPIREHAMVILSAADLILQLQQRLVRQACYYEHIEAESQQQWPLLEDDDPGMGL